MSLETFIVRLMELKRDMAEPHVISWDFLSERGAVHFNGTPMSRERYHASWTFGEHPHKIAAYYACNTFHNLLEGLHRAIEKKLEDFDASE